MFQKERYEEILAQCAACSATLIVVTKSQPITVVQALYDYGHRDFGENRLQEMLPKSTALPPDVRWHFQGTIQSNKWGKILAHSDCVHSVSSLPAIASLTMRAPTLPVYLQVNVTKEASKGGFSEASLPEALNAAAGCTVLGLMTMAEQGASPHQTRMTFRKTRELADANGLHGCSMGMSGDYQIALDEGATAIRIGRSLFLENG